MIKASERNRGHVERKISPPGNEATKPRRHDGSRLATEITEATETDAASLFNRGLRGLRGCQEVVCKPAICVRMTAP